MFSRIILPITSNPRVEPYLLTFLIHHQHNIISAGPYYFTLTSNILQLIKPPIPCGRVDKHQFRNNHRTDKASTHIFLSLFLESSFLPYCRQVNYLLLGHATPAPPAPTKKQRSQEHEHLQWYEISEVSSKTKFETQNLEADLTLLLFSTAEEKELAISENKIKTGDKVAGLCLISASRQWYL